MNGHLSDEQLIGYSHATLTDAEREAMDQHLADCPHCRARLSEHEALQRHIHHDLLADLRTARPPAGLTFSAIAPRLKRPNIFAGLWRRSGQLVPSAMALAALAGVVVALLGLIKGTDHPTVGIRQIHTIPLPTVACFLFAIPVIGNYYESRVVPSRSILSGVVVFILWVGTAIVGLYEMLLVREMLFRIYIYVQSSSSGLCRQLTSAAGAAASRCTPQTRLRQLTCPKRISIWYERVWRCMGISLASTSETSCL